MQNPKSGEIWRNKHSMNNSECIIISRDAVASGSMLTTIIYQYINGSPKFIVSNQLVFVENFEYVKPAKKPKLIEELSNLIFSKYQWYRKSKGGNWYLLEVADYSLGNTFMWTQNLPDLKEVNYYVRDVEDHN